MTTMTPPTETPPPPPPPPGPPPGAPVRRLQRSASDRVAGGVAGGLGEYFGLDPVLFRVLFAVAAFFGGFGVIAYAVLWFTLPEAGDTSTSSPVDRLGLWLKAHNVPVWLAALVAVVGFWIVAGGFGGWATHGLFFPGAAIVGVVLLVVAFSRRGGLRSPASSRPPTGVPPADAPTVSLQKQDGDPLGDTADATTTATRPMDDWWQDARERGRRRRRRARPLFLATLGATVVALAVVVLVDAVSGVALPVYAAVGGGVVLLGLITGIVLRRPAFSLIWFLVPAVVWLAAFAGTHTSFRDGAGDVSYRPSSAAQLEDDYRLAFGRVTLDLTDVYGGATTTTTTTTTAATDRVTVRVGAGVARVVVPDDAAVTVVGQVRAGGVVVDGTDLRDRRGSSGWRTTTRLPARGDDGPPLLVVLQVTDGVAVVDHTAA